MPGGKYCIAMKRILVTNDDGITTRGIAILAEAMSAIGEVTVVAPDREMSAISHALTLKQTLRVKEIRPRWWAVGGTPTDCVYLGMNRLVNGSVDLVVSGVNRGANLGQDVHYSGTVAGAVEGSILGTSAIAFSQILGGDERADLERAALFARGLAREVLQNSVGKRPLLNVNFPSGEARGVKLTRLGSRNYSDTLEERIDGRGIYEFRIAGSAVHYDQAADTDCQVAQDGYISVTPLQIDLTDFEACVKMASWEVFRDES
jgi:5'-nucleotidase